MAQGRRRIGFSGASSEDIWERNDVGRRGIDFSCIRGGQRHLSYCCGALSGSGGARAGFCRGREERAASFERGGKLPDALLWRE